MVDLELRMSRRSLAMAALASPALAVSGTSLAGRATAAAAQEAGAEPQTPVVIVQGVEVPTLDPQFAESGALANILFTIFDGLIAYSKEMEIVPEAADSWELLDDNVTWQFKLRQGITFWNGEPLDAHAVKFTFDRIGNEELRSQGLNDPYYSRVGFDHADVVDDLTVNLVLQEPSILFPVYTTFVSILAPQYYSETPPEETAIRPMGSGPWMFEEWVKDDHLTLTANPDYFLGQPPIETVIFRPVPEGSTRMAMLETGEADIIADASPEDVARMEGADNIHSCITNDGRRVHIGLPTEQPLFSDRRVRHALNLAVDFDAINQAILGGVAEGRMATPCNGEFWVNPDVEPYPYDPERAQQLLSEAGWDPATAVTIFSPNGRYLKDTEIAQVVAGQWRQVGVEAEVQVLEWSVFSEMGRTSAFEMPYLIGYGSRYFGPDDVSILFEGGFQGVEWVDNTELGPEAKRLMDELTTTFDEQRQQELVFRISEIFAEEAPWLFLWKQVGLFGVSNRTDWECAGKARTELWYAGGEPTQFTT